ncbi:MAG: glycosyltransferase family 4 protein, partial [Methanomicrobiales archaeon]|nr:glycosyltransferase family 4 protein [Methanomicrobiales archaeon]
MSACTFFNKFNGKTDPQKTTVLIVTSSFPCPPLWMDGGFIWTKAVTLREKGFSVIVLCPHGNGAPLHEDRDGIIIHRFPYLFPFRAEKLSGGRGLYHAAR